MNELLQTLILWPLLWVLAGLAGAKLLPKRADAAGIVGMLVGVLFTLAVFGTPVPGHFLSATLAWPAVAGGVLARGR